MVREAVAPKEKEKKRGGGEEGKNSRMFVSIGPTTQKESTQSNL